MFHLSGPDQKKLAALANPCSVPRKNLWIIIAVVNTLRTGRHATVTSKLCEEAIDALNLRHRWALDPDAKDGFGLQKAIGDLLGGHGLKLEHAGRGKGGIIFAIPRGGIDEAYIKSIDLDPEDIEGQALIEDLFEAIKDRRVILFKYEGDPADAAYRRFAPHIYYKGKSMPMVAGTQSGGYSSSEAQANTKGKTTPTWRIFQADKMIDIKLTENRFHKDPSFRTRPDAYKDAKIYAEIEVYQPTD